MFGDTDYTSHKEVTAIRLNPELKAVVESMQEKKGEEVTVLDLQKHTTMTDYFVFCSADSEPQIKAITRNIEERMKSMGLRPDHIEGRPETGWVLMDYDDFVVHIMLPERRTYYDLERLWADAPRVTVDDSPRRASSAR
jgi:ribosome-associated protein